ncbi:type II toxin-antitoxin system MqsA family antitoxin [Rhizobium sp. S163]|uniref:type II toxin-antitoxin system MqsA family antitoxin n=1 Tax=Rhizobium sp. S163 TaxID=3055039 RepID=UPI0025A98BC6|nr:type II toxin-antitoxin system MqsA family antitoxin [Rhizobium sp. S163]MDM9649042.1 type II toxin-antitoxin system MqsA family antitoxin [Rhizobium sp. S163]
MAPFANETHQVVFRDMKVDVEGLSGFRCGACGEIEYDHESAERYAAAGDALVLEARKALGSELRRIRKKLRINQVEASELTGGGHNAFSRYETGKVMPTPAVVNLFRLLDRDPGAIKELKRA